MKMANNKGIFKVKIIKTKHHGLWYAEMIGKVIDVKNDYDNGYTYTCVETGHGIWISDVEKL